MLITYSIRWIAASLVMPLIVLLFGKVLNELLVLVFWPGSIALMSLGSEQKPVFDVVYAWGFAICLNMVLYLSVGMVIFYLLKIVKRA